MVPIGASSSQRGRESGVLAIKWRRCQDVPTAPSRRPERVVCQHLHPLATTRICCQWMLSPTHPVHSEPGLHDGGFVTNGIPGANSSHRVCMLTVEKAHVMLLDWLH
jgi:hypothetical protein